MTLSRVLPALALATGLLLSAGSAAQPPVVRAAPPAAEAALPVVPKSAGAFVTLRVSDLLAHPDLKSFLAQLAKQPDALVGLTEVVGVPPQDIDRVTLFWPRVGLGVAPVLVVTTREPFNEARVLKALKADPVFEGNAFRGGRDGHGFDHGRSGVKSAPSQKRPEFVDPKEDSPPLKGPGEPPIVKDAKPISPPPVEKCEGDSCTASADGGIADPLFYALDRGPFAALFLIDDRTLVFLPGGSDGEFAQLSLLAAGLKKNATGPLADAIAAAGKHTLAAGVHLAPLFREFDRHVPAELVPYTALFAARTAVLTADLDAAAKFNLTLTFDDATAAKRAAPVLEEGVATVVEKMTEWADELKDTGRPVEKAAIPLISALTTGLKKSAVKADGATVTASAAVDVGPAAAKALGDLLQAVQSRKKAEQRMNNLKQIGIALHSYHDANGKFPANVYSPTGELLLSWRVQLLPYLEESNLYNQFKMNEAWDGPNNKALVEKMPKVFQAPDREHAKGKTFYQGFIGPDPRKQIGAKGFVGRPWLVEGGKDGIRMTDIFDGTSNTLAVVEARDGVMWSKPEDLSFGGAVPALGEKGSDRAPALRFDGSAVLIPTNFQPGQFWPYVTTNGGEVTDDLDGRTRRSPFGARPSPQPSVTAPSGK